MKKIIRWIVSIILYVLSIALFAYAIWAFIQSKAYIKGLIDLGQVVVEGSEYDIINYYMQGSASYIVYSVIFTVMGLKISNVLDDKEKSKPIVVVEKSEGKCECEDEIVNENKDNTVEKTDKNS